MDENLNDVADISNQQEEADLDTANEENYEQEEESIEELKAAKEKAEKLANNYKIRAEKAEKAAKAKPEFNSKQSSTAGDISSKDLYALMNAKVAPEDIDEIKDYASMKKISISEALNTNVVKSILNDKAEQRKVALASNVGNSKRVSNNMTDDALLNNFKKGILPESDEDIERLVKLRSK